FDRRLAAGRHRQRTRLVGAHRRRRSVRSAALGPPYHRARRPPPGGSRARRIGGVVPGQRCPFLDADGRHRTEWSGPRLMLNPLKVPVSWTDLAKRTSREVLADDCLGLAAQLAYYFFLAL